MTAANRAGLLGLLGYVLMAVCLLDLGRHDPPYVPYVTVLVHLPVAIVTLMALLAARKRTEEGGPVPWTAALLLAGSYVGLAAVLLFTAPIVFWDFIAR